MICQELHAKTAVIDNANANSAAFIGNSNANRVAIIDNATANKTDIRNLVLHTQIEADLAQPGFVGKLIDFAMQLLLYCGAAKSLTRDFFLL